MLCDAQLIFSEKNIDGLKSKDAIAIFCSLTLFGQQSTQYYVELDKTRHY